MLFAELPLDIIHYIFLCGTEDLQTAANLVPAYSYPLKLTGICKQWTETALACPALWSTICLHERRGELRPPLDVAERWIQRSGSHPLSFSIASRIDGLPGSADILQTLFAPHYSRWRKINVPVPFPLAILPKEVLNPQYPELHEITATTHFSSSSAHDPQEWERVGMNQMFDMLSRATGLSTASFWFTTKNRHFADRLLSSMGRPDGPWATLSNLTLQLTSFNPTMATQVLSQCCPNLVSLAIHLLVTRDDLRALQPTSNIVHHASLRTLSFKSRKNPHVCAGILGQLTLPNLRGLDFEVLPTMESEAQPALDAIVGFLTRSRCPLEVVHIDAQSLIWEKESTASVPAQVIRALSPSVHTLTIKVKPDSGELAKLLEALIVDEERMVLPRLQTLTLWASKWDERCYSMAVDMVESRCNARPGGGIQTLVLRLVDVWNPRWKAALEDFKGRLLSLGGSLSEDLLFNSMLGKHVALTWKPNWNRGTPASVDGVKD